MSVSAVILTAGITYRGRAFLGEALRAAAEGSDEIVTVTTDGRISNVAGPLLANTDLVTSAVDVPGPFNFSRAVNAGVTASSGTWVLLLNDDVALPRPTRRTKGWVATLAQRPGFVKGVLLTDSSGERIEHAGVWFAGPGGLPCHIGWHEPVSLGYEDGPALAVTAAVMMVKRSVFDQLGGFDEDFPVHFGDVDFCLRAHKAGLNPIVYNSIQLVHREASTRTPVDLLPDFRRLKERHGEFLAESGIQLSVDAVVAHFS